MSAAASPVPPEARTPTSPRHHAGNSQSNVPSRTQSMNAHDSPPNSGRRRSGSHTNSLSQNRPPSAAKQASLAAVAKKDIEQTNLARTPSSRRPSSADRYHGDSRPSQSDAPGAGTQQSASRSRPISRADETPRAPSGTAPPETLAKPNPNNQAPKARRTTLDAQTGHWALGKTIGQGSMGKVKLARNLETSEQVAVKIVDRQSRDDHRNQQDRERAEHSKEIRTAREAAIVTLVNHPYICGMRDVLRTQNHWYMLFEYVNGGQMLDYIISHGRLKEKQARKFGRQIASALDYCHRNSIVHRDLKIENILISKSGDIKIIDFGLSNLFSPRSLLNTFCGSLYFAAPELLQAKAYTGPEVDVWSFGIVLYVLVCGRVPFDDQSMPQLHAKIKKGYVEYPPWLTADCKSLIGRTLQVDPKLRASLSEVLCHPWMTKGFSGPPDNHLPPREPLQLPLDRKVIVKMTGFDFGSEEYITRELEKAIESEEYQRAIRLAARRPQASPSEYDRRKGGMFDFYQRRKSATSKDTLMMASSETLQLGDDPVNAFNPLISIYYLVREKQERELVEQNPGALAMPQSPGEKPLQLPDLPAPVPAHTNPGAFEMAGEAPTGGRTRPRARTHGEDDASAVLQKSKNGGNAAQRPAPQPIDSTPRKEGLAGGLLRRFSTRRTPKDVDREKTGTALPPHVATVDTEEPVGTLRKSFSVRKTRDNKGTATPPSAYRGPASARPEHLAPPLVDAAGTSKGNTTALGRSASVNSGETRRRWSRRSVEPDRAPSSQFGAMSASERSSFADSKFSEAQSDNEQSHQRSASSRAQSVGTSNRGSLQARRPQRDGLRHEGVPEETDQELAEEHATTSGYSRSMQTMKPIYMRGLFSVSTTSSKPLSFIRADLIRVLTQLNVEFHEMRGGFSCRHKPSIDLSKVVDNPPAADGSRPAQRSASHRRRISFAAVRASSRDRDRATDPDAPASPKPPPRRTLRAESSYTASEADEETDPDDDLDASGGARSPGPTSAPLRSPSARYSAHLPPSAQRGATSAPQRPAGETSTHVQSDLGQSMILRFDILVIKVPLLSLHGLQFKKLDGGTWQYKTMADAILTELRL